MKKLMKYGAGLVALLAGGVLFLGWRANAPYRERDQINERLKSVEFSERSSAASLHRERADCEATEIEDPAHQAMQDTCWDDFKASQAGHDRYMQMLGAERADLKERLNTVEAQIKTIESTRR